MARQYEDRVTIIGVASRDDAARFEEFVDRHDLHHVDHIDDEGGEVWQRFGVVAQPVWVFVDGDTGAVDTVFGAVGAQQLAERFDSSS